MRAGLIPRALALCALGALGACAGSVPDLRTTITRAQLDTVDTPLMLAEVAAIDAQATLIPWGENGAAANGAVVTWRTGDGVSLAFAGGVITATRGLGADLMSADVSAVQAALAGGPRENYERFASFVDGDLDTVFRAQVCTMTVHGAAQIVNIGLGVQTRHYEERCRSTTDDVTNSYWVGADGIIWRSRQWIGPGAGYLVTERLVR